MVNNVYDLVTRTMEQEFPGRVAFRWVEDATGTVKEKTYAEYAQDIRRAAAWFARNIPEVEGKRVVLLSRNCYEYGVNTFGAVLAGAVLVTMNQKKTWDELSWELELAEPALVLNDGVDYGCRDQLEAAYGERLRPMDVWKGTAPGGLEKKIDPNALMVMLFTSGTTGRSKAVMLAERNFFTVMQMHVAMGDHMLDFKHRQLPEDKNDVLSNFAILPLFHLGTFICLFSWPFKGWALNLCSDLRNFYRDLGLMHSDSIAVAPVLMESIYKDVKRGRADKLNGLWNPCGSSAMFDSELLLGLVENGMYITQCYGMTETSPIISVNKVGHNHPNTVGPALPNIEVRLGEGDELQVRGPTVMKGYWNREEATKAIFTEDGWLRTGDVCTIYPDGNIRITGRIKEIIVTSTGEKVPPADLESAITSDRLFSQCMVVGDDRPFIAAVAVVNPDEFKTVCGELGLDPAKPESLQDPAFRKAALKRIKTSTAGFPNYGVPRQVHCTLDAWTIDNGLLTPTLKMKRNLIRQRYTAEINALYDTLVKR